MRLAHARVLDSWQRAKAIVTENADFYRVRADVEEQRRKWEAAKRSRDLLIGRGRPLAEAESIVRRFPEEIPVATRDFIKRSGRRARLAQTVTAAAAVLFAVVASAAIYAERAGHPRSEGSRRSAPARRRVARGRVAGCDAVTAAAFQCRQRREDNIGETMDWAPPSWSSYLHRQRAVVRMQSLNLSAARIDVDYARESRCRLPAFAGYEQRPICNVGRR